MMAAFAPGPLPPGMAQEEITGRPPLPRLGYKARERDSKNGCVRHAEAMVEFVRPGNFPYASAPMEVFRG